MQTYTERKPSVVIVATDNERSALLKKLVYGTKVARSVDVCDSFPVERADPATRCLWAVSPDVILVDIPVDNSQLALRSIELLHHEIRESAIFAIGSLNQPQVIVNAMRAGAREFIERPTTTAYLLEAFVRLNTAQRRRQQEGLDGRVFSVINAKGGSGATTVAVNLALALQAAYEQTALVDLAPVGHAALHMNLKPAFTVADATHNMHRMDASLLERLMTLHSGGLQLLASTPKPTAIDSSIGELDRLFDMLMSHYRYVVVDSSSRFDAATRLIARLSENVLLVCSDVESLRYAAGVQEYLGEAGSRERVRLILNRFPKVPGFSEADAEAAVGAKVLWRVPNHDRATPVMVARCFAGLAQELTRRNWIPPRT